MKAALKQLPQREATLKLMPNVQFVYELHLAALEVASFAGDWRIGDDYRRFVIGEKSGLDSILHRSAYIGEIDGIKTDYAELTARNVTRAFNQYITHWFYPYKGKFHPQMVRALANIIGMREGDSLLDPFVGSGTAAVEAALLGVKCIGLDASPLCALIAKVKVNAVHHYAKIKNPPGEEFMPTANADPLPPPADISKMLTNPLVGFLRLAELITLSDRVRRNRKSKNLLSDNLDKMIRSVELMRDGCRNLGIKPTPADIRVGDARTLPLADESIDGIITSPPYSIALNYAANDAHALDALGLNTARIADEFIGVRGVGKQKLRLYREDMSQAYSEMRRVLKPGAKAAIILGDAVIGGESADSVRECINSFTGDGYRLLHNIDKIIYGLYNVMLRESILIFEKPR